MTNFLQGAIAMAAMAAALIFLRFHRRTRDRFFLYFVASFLLEAAGRALTVAWQWTEQGSTTVYILRIVSYGLILAAILDKNLPRRKRG
ncbi:hypothetical protein FHW12_002082 [Dokdonella fugitiva]|uniref:Uncharacterized protein n=1 Tax=Dokdonella fugitiva TaxID=328517 RepID=A0A839F2X0_9GAMM|nr:DUF5985 family protein [Dokdonella fugitiva]MBA8887868.1 hypothetical protein [Dokdonella fugitiva]